MDIDEFFYQGERALDDEIKSGVECTVCTPQYRCFYFRDYGSGISDFENAPISAVSKTLLKYNIVRAIAIHNENCGDGNGGTRDRRVITSQSEVNVTSDGQDVNIQVGYLPVYNMSKQTLDVSLGGL